MRLKPICPRGLRIFSLIARIEISPARVRVEGPESDLREKDRVTTSPVNISGIEATTSFTADLILPRPELRLAGSQDQVQVRVIIREDEFSPGCARTPRCALT